MSIMEIIDDTLFKLVSLNHWILIDNLISFNNSTDAVSWSWSFVELLWEFEFD